MRRDLRVPNESDGFVFARGSLRGSGLSPGEPPWDAACRAGGLLPLAVESEDPANVRVLVDEDPSSEEQQGWVGVVRGALRLPEGRLALCGGIAWLIDGDDWTLDYVRELDIPPGDYRATVYCYPSAPNGRWCLEAAGSDEPLGAWFRRSRPAKGMPAWLHNLCIHDPDLDPGHQGEWSRARERTGEPVIDFLLHLESITGPLPVAVPGDTGFLDAQECRQPEPFPVGLAADGVDDGD